MPKFSIIIPAHNAERTLAFCLDPWTASREKDFEIFVVDDASTDASVSVAKRYPCRVICTEKKRGAGGARNFGAEHASGEFLVFLDADVVVRPDTLGVLAEAFRRDPQVTAVTGLLAWDAGSGNFFSAYKNLYMHYTFSRCPREVDFLYGSLMAVRKEDFLKFNESFALTDDTELGQRYKKLGKKILLVPELEVIHLKRYTWNTILKNDFLVPFWWARSFIAHRGFTDILKQGRFAHARLSQQVSLAVSFLLLACIPMGALPPFGVLAGIFAVLFFLLNAKFFYFVSGNKDLLFLLTAVVFTWVDQIAMGLGLAAGLVYHGHQKNARSPETG